MIQRTYAFGKKINKIKFQVGYMIKYGTFESIQDYPSI